MKVRADKVRERQMSNMSPIAYDSFFINTIPSLRSCAKEHPPAEILALPDATPAYSPLRTAPVPGDCYQKYLPCIYHEGHDIPRL